MSEEKTNHQDSHNTIIDICNDLENTLDDKQNSQVDNDMSVADFLPDDDEDIQEDQSDQLTINAANNESQQSKHPDTKQKTKVQKKSKKKMAAIVCAIVLACGGGYLYTDFVATRTAIKIHTTQAEQDKIANDVLAFLSKPHSSDEIEKTMILAFKSLPTERCTSLVDTYLYGVYNTAAQYTLDDDQTNKLYAAMNKDGSINMDLVDSDELKQQVSDLAEQHIVLKYLNGALFWDVDYAYFDDTFSQYVNPDYRDVIHFYAEEKKNSYSNEDGERLYTQIVTKRLDSLFTMMATYPDSEIYDIMQESYYFYKAVYLGAYAQDYIFDSGSVRPEILESYQEYVKTCQDEELQIFIQKILDEYTESNGVRTIPVYESIKEFCGFYEQNKKE